MSVNKQTVERYLEGFRRSDHAAILSCLTNDIEWVMEGAFRLRGKAEFDGEIENPAFTGRPDIRLVRLVEENDVVIAEGTVKATRVDGGELNAHFCDVFEMRHALIARLTTYLVVLRNQ